jgi:hypothetical protein
MTETPLLSRNRRPAAAREPNHENKKRTRREQKEFAKNSGIGRAASPLCLEGV